jgi:hypothetical protein
MSRITRTLLSVAVTAAAVLAVLAVARPASAEITNPNVLAPAKADLVIGSHSGGTFTVTNLPCGAVELICTGGPGTASASNFSVTVANGYYSTFAIQPGWLSWSRTYTVASLAAGASVSFPYSLYGFCGWVSVTADDGNVVPERNEWNNGWGFSLYCG